MADKDFENRFFDLLEDNFKALRHDNDELRKGHSRLEKKVDDNTKKTEEGFASLIGRVTALENDRKIKKADLDPWYRDPVFIKTIIGTLLVIVAAWLGVKLPSAL